MTRTKKAGGVEEALSKLRANDKRSSEQDSSPSEPTRVFDSTNARSAREHSYGGRQLDINLGNLEFCTLVSPDPNAKILTGEFTSIKQPLLRNAKTELPSTHPGDNLIAVTSALDGEGKSFTSLNLGLSIANEEDWSVVLIDGDTSKSHLTELMNAKDEPGLIDLLQDSSLSFDSLVMPTSVPGFAFLPSGGSHDRCAELFGSERMEQICLEMAVANRRRIIIFDSAPLLMTSHASVLTSQVGQIVLVVRANGTPQHAVLAARDKLDLTKAVNVLLNQASHQEGIGDYGDYYGASS